MGAYKCACCGTPIRNFFDDWLGCVRCGCVTAELVRYPEPTESKESK